MSNRINLLPYREARRKAANRQFGVMAILSAGLALAVVLSAHGVTAGYLLAQESRNNFIAAENKTLDGQIEEIKRLKGEIDQLKARKDVIEMLQSDRAAAVRVLEQMVKLAPEGVYLKTIKQQGLKLTITGNATSNEIVANFLGAIEGSQVLQKPELVEIKAITVGTRRFSEFNLTAELIRVQKEPENAKAPGKKSNAAGDDKLAGLPKSPTPALTASTAPTAPPSPSLPSSPASSVAPALSPAPAAQKPAMAPAPVAPSPAAPAAPVAPPKPALPGDSAATAAAKTSAEGKPQVSQGATGITGIPALAPSESSTAAKK